MAVRSPGNIPRFLIPGFVYLTITFLYIFSSPSFSFAAWTPQTIPTTETLYAVYFVDANNGYAVGAAGTVIKTIDGGSTWTTAASAGAANLNAVYFIDANNGWVAGVDGIYRTINGATSWVLQTAAIQFEFIVFTPDGSTGFAGANNGTLYWSIDGGSTWNLHPATFDGTPIVSIEFIDNNTGFLVTQGGDVYNTIDGGASWTALNSVPPQMGDIRDSSWVDSLHGWVIGGGARELAYTTDGGNNWTLGPNVVSFDYNAVHFTTTLNGYLVDDSGNIRQTTDGGLTWVIVGNAGGELFDIFIAPGGEIYVVGDPDAIFTETPPITLIKQVWELGGTAPLVSPLTSPIGARLVFLIYVKNDTSSAINNVTFVDNLDNTTFSYVVGSLYMSSTPLADTATDLQIFNAAKPPSQGGTGISQTDDLGVVDYSAACTGPGPGPGHCPGGVTNLLTFGATTNNTNQSLDLPANSTVAFRFEVIIQ